MKIEKNSELLNSIKSAGIILRPSSPELKETYLNIKALFEKANIEMYLEDNSANMINLKGYPLDELCNKVDFLISVGGDGTLLSVVRKSFKYDKAVLGINLGTLGFLTDISMEQLPDFIEDLKDIENKYGQMKLISKINRKRFNDLNGTYKNLRSLIWRKIRTTTTIKKY